MVSEAHQFVPVILSKVAAQQLMSCDTFVNAFLQLVH